MTINSESYGKGSARIIQRESQDDILAFDHRGSFATKMFGWKGALVAVGRTDFWEPPVNWRANKVTREAAVAEIARRYREFVDVETASTSRLTAKE